MFHTTLLEEEAETKGRHSISEAYMSALSQSSMASAKGAAAYKKRSKGKGKGQQQGRNESRGGPHEAQKESGKEVTGSSQDRQFSQKHIHIQSRNGCWNN